MGLLREEVACKMGLHKKVLEKIIFISRIKTLMILLYNKVVILFSS